MCYREAAGEQFNEFVTEVEQQGRMCADTRQMLGAMEDKPTNDADEGASEAQKIADKVSLIVRPRTVVKNTDLFPEIKPNIIVFSAC